MGERQTSLDILKIYATLQVVMFHISEPFGFHKPSTSNMFVFVCVFFITSNLHFMLISGYIGTRTRFAFSKLIPIILQTLFYSLFFYYVAIFFIQNATYSKWELVSLIFPLANAKYWYAFPYMIWEVLFSVLYPILSKLDTRYYKTICFIFLWVHVLPWVGFYKFVGLDANQSIGSFMAMGLISSYFAYHYTEVSKFKLIILYIILFIYNFLVHQKPEYFITEWRLLKLFGDVHWMRLPAIMFAMTSFYIAISIKGQFKYHSVIQAIAQCSLGVFMFHCTSYIMRYWGVIMRSRMARYGPDYIFVLCYSTKLFIVGVLIETVRQHLFNVLIFKRDYYCVITQYVDYFLMNKPLSK